MYSTKAADFGLLPSIVTLSSTQIEEVQIFKSYKTHTTDITVWVEELDPNVAVAWSEGKYIAEIIISPYGITEDATQVGASNFFVCVHCYLFLVR